MPRRIASTAAASPMAPDSSTKGGGSPRSLTQRHASSAVKPGSR